MRFLARLPSVLLIVLAVVFLAGALWIAYRVVICGIAEPTITVAALLATVAGLFLTAQRQIADRQEATSRFYLEQYRAGFDTAYEILDSAAPGNPFIRVKWIAAARVLATARELLERVSVAAHREVAQMSVPHQSQRFHRFFEMQPWYYYGVSTPANVSHEEAMKLAAERSTAQEGMIVSTVHSVPERVIKTVWQAVAYPAGYKDVLGDRFRAPDRLSLPEGLRSYLQHREEWHSAAGKLRKRLAGEPIE